MCPPESPQAGCLCWQSHPLTLDNGCRITQLGLRSRPQGCSHATARRLAISTPPQRQDSTLSSAQRQKGAQRPGFHAAFKRQTQYQHPLLPHSLVLAQSASPRPKGNHPTPVGAQLPSPCPRGTQPLPSFGTASCPPFSSRGNTS